MEVERARLTALVVKKLESEGKVEEAANLILDLQVETYGSMEIKEKVCPGWIYKILCQLN